MVVQLSILVSNNDSLVGLGYSRIEVWQSNDSGDTYQEITASTPQSAAVTSFEAFTTFQMGGRLLKFKVDGGTEYSVPFDPNLVNWTPAQVTSRINQVLPGTATTVGNSVRLSSQTTGRVSSIEITYNDAISLGLPPGTIAYGLDARPTLVLGTTLYTYYDVAGTAMSRYKWRFSANGVNPVSTFSNYVLGSAVPLVNGGQLSVCSATFVQLNGQPRKTKVVIGSDQNPSNISGMILATGQSIIIQSGDDGWMQFTLVRGATVRVAIEGTYFVREFVVPDTAAFDLLTVMTASPDPFTVQAPPPFLIRRSI